MSAHRVTADRINDLSEWVDAGIRWDDVAGVSRSDEAMLMHRTQKIAEEYGEVVAAIIGATGANPRKGLTHDLDSVANELLDVALAALAAWAHMKGNRADAVTALVAHVDHIHHRAGLS